MNTAWSIDELLRPIGPDAACGKTLEDTPLLGTLDRLMVFGRRANYSTRKRDDPPDSTTEPDWSEVRAASLAALATSKDLRALAHLGASSLWIDGLHPFVDSVVVAAHWLETYWNEVHPRLDEDAMVRQNALLCFADNIAVVNRLRRTPLVHNRLQGAFSLRDIELASGLLTPGESDVSPQQAEIASAFESTSTDQLEGLLGVIGRALDGTQRIGLSMETHAADWVPDLTPLTNELKKIDRHLARQLAQRLGDSTTVEEVAAGTSVEAPSGPIGAVKSRQEAIRALDSVAAFFRQSEPSSPIPMIVERAKRLVSKDFLEVLADIAPEAIAQARSAGGLPPGE